MFDQSDLKWLAAHTTELNSLMQQLSRYSEHARQHQGEKSYLDLLHDRVALASRKSQELFDRVTSRILSGVGNGAESRAVAMNRIAAMPVAAHTDVIVRMPLGEIQESCEQRRLQILNPHGARELILLVDDDEELLETTGAMLDFEDYRIVTAKSGPQALRIYREMGKEIALVILDYFLPVMDGDVVFEQLKAMDPDVRVVLSSGFSEHAQLGNMLARGLRGFIPKPYTHERLIEQIRSVLDA